jgi:hypothetical protein
VEREITLAEHAAVIRALGKRGGMAPAHYFHKAGEIVAAGSQARGRGPQGPRRGSAVPFAIKAHTAALGNEGLRKFDSRPP